MEEIAKDVSEAIDTLTEKIQKYEHQVNWEEVYSSDEKLKHIKLFVSYNDDGLHELKCEAVLKDCDPERLYNLNVDNEFRTRQMWETGELGGIKQMETYNVDSGKANLVEYWVKLPIGVQNRVFQGIQWHKYDEERKIHTIAFQSKLPDRFPCDTANYTLGDCFSIMLIWHQKVTIYTAVRLNGWIPDWIVSMWKEKLRARMFLYETLVKDNERYNNIYKKQVCPKCESEWSYKAEKCRKCESQF